MIVLPDGLDPKVVALIRAVQDDLPIIENPVGSNRSPEINAMCREFGVPVGSPWCALWTASKRKQVGAAYPPIHGDQHPAIAESWHQWAKATGRFTSKPQLGYATLYSLHRTGKADHIAACVMSLTPILMDAQGNTSQEGVSRDGALTALKPVRTDYVLGYVSLEPL